MHQRRSLASDAQYALLQLSSSHKQRSPARQGWLASQVPLARCREKNRTQAAPSGQLVASQPSTVQYPWGDAKSQNALVIVMLQS